MTYQFPYKKFESTELWNVINQAIGDLVDNNDMKESTARENIVGYLSKTIFDSGLVNNKSNSND